MIKYLEYFTSSVDANTPIGAVYLDFRKAFVTVPQKYLVEKPRFMKINQLIVAWMDNWFSETKQRVGF